MLIHLIRHTTPDIETGICYGQTDLDVASSFEQEKNIILSKTLPEYDAVFTSPLQRCAKLAEYINGQHRFTEPRIMEYNFGDWELLPWSEFKSEGAKSWMNNFVDQPAPNGDSMISMQQRVMEFFDALLQKNYSSVALVTHSGVQRLIHGYILETSLKHLFRLQLEFGAVLEVNSDLSNGLLTIKHL